VTVLTLAIGWLATATAAEPGKVFFETSPGAQVVVFPRVEERTIDIGIYRNRASIRDQIQGTSARYALDVDAVAIGNGTSYLTIHTDRDGILPRVLRRDGFFEIRLQPGEVELAPTPPPPSFESILDPEQRRRPARPPLVPLTPLRGDAATIGTDPREIRLHLPSWEPDLDSDEVLGQLLDLNRTDWAAVDDYRQVLTSTEDDYLKQVSRYRLGLAYTDLGLPREASYYVHGLLDGAHRPDVTVLLLAAQADFGVGRWDEGRDHCRAASEAGAEEAQVLACMAAPALATGNPNPTGLGRTLAASSDVPEDLLLAAQLLQMDHRHQESIGILERIALQLPLARMRHAYLCLGDARYAIGKIDEAINAWTQVKRGDELGEVARLRIYMAEIARQPRTSWAKHIPELARISRQSERQGVEALYLLAQIAQAYGNMADAGSHLNDLWLRDRETAVDSDVPDRLLAVCTERLRWLDREQRYVDLAAYFKDCWRPELDAFAPNPRTLQRVALAHEALGLHDRALRIQQRVTTHHTTGTQDDPASLTHLARMYVNADRPMEALDTIAYSRRHLKPSELRGPLQVSQALALEATGDSVGAERAWRAATQVSASRSDARRGLGLLLARRNRCSEAVAYLDDPEDGEEDPELLLSRARCLLDRKRPAQASAEVAPLMASTDPDLKKDAEWIAAAASWQDRKPNDIEEVEIGVWKRIINEERDAAAFDTKLEALAEALAPIQRNP